jgi:hypothetical protein
MDMLQPHKPNLVPDHKCSHSHLNTRQLQRLRSSKHLEPALGKLARLAQAPAVVPFLMSALRSTL